MMINLSRILLTGFFALALIACSKQASVSDSGASMTQAANSVSSSVVSRWYSGEQKALGSEVFAQNCAVCHGAQAQGTVEDWPLNGSAHAWHHPQEILLQVVNYGGESLGGKMPAFIDVLDDAEKLAAIAYFQSFWTDDIYQQWMQMGGTN